MSQTGVARAEAATAKAAQRIAAGTSMVVIHYRDQPAVQRLLSAVAGWSLAPERIVVVDNSSDLRLDDLPSSVMVSDPGSNDGYGAAVNHAWSEVLARPRQGFLLVCTQDADIAADGFERMVDAVLTDPRTGVVAPVLAYRDDPARTFSQGGRLSRRGVPTHIGTGEPVAAAPDPTIEQVDWADGAVLLVRNEVMAELGGFAEEYFLYVEEIDFAFAARLRGWRVVVAGGARASQQPGDYRTYLRYRNSIHFSRKFRPHLRTWPWPRFLFEDTARKLLRRHRFPFFEACRGILDGLRGQMHPRTLARRD